MPWLRSRRRFTPPPTAPVPASEAVRMAALRASWRRDRWVAQRRLWFRWTLWGLQRYALQISGGVLTLALLGWWFLPAPLRLPSAAPMAEAPQPAKAADTKTAAASTASPAPASPPLPIESPGDASSPLPLRLDTAWGAVRTPPLAPPVGGPQADPNTSLIPQLKPENWLHSKEP